MGTIQHDIMAVTHYDAIKLNEIRKKALDLFDYLVSPTIESATNNYYTFFISPDGSQEGWELSNYYNKRRETFIAYLQDCKATWVHVSYGELGNELKESS